MKSLQFVNHYTLAPLFPYHHLFFLSEMCTGTSSLVPSSDLIYEFVLTEKLFNRKLNVKDSRTYVSRFH